MKTFLKIVGIAVLLAILASGVTFYLHPLAVNDSILRYKLWHAGVQSHYVEANGYELHYLEALPPSGSPEHTVVLIHGLGSRGEDWAPLIPGLAAAGFHIYAPDLLGYGRSPRPDVPYTMDLEEKTVVSFLDALHLAKPDVGGWSMGGWVALKLAVEHPDRVHRLMLYDSAGLYFPPTFDTDLFAPTNRAGLARLMSAISPHPRLMPGFVQDDALRKLQRNSWIVNRSMAAMVSGKELMDFRLHLIQQPTLIVWGSHDDLIPLSAGERMHKGIDRSTLVVMEGCGHLAPAECWKPVEETTLDFLKADPPLAPGQKTIPNADQHN
ncbi:Pimeloyl-ACP methyl ester carboxylesterase [Granulicella pectinivorans]|uniref:Pimeloyl-ACP methyl ester carboxylesterase n=1 Tax=Granulicella pectinivorans TaxID=474950 RepID=A0A1I6N0U7_9BACT|nr:alpha/beta hydrolase [Granulicella pectinivorans]SFS21556.1 Pimeloyl-ACP methyl ester carboxylesterase [Granulicella pectinivorans]